MTQHKASAEYLRSAQARLICRVESEEIADDSSRDYKKRSELMAK
jgi:hypothetical protein